MIELKIFIFVIFKKVLFCFYLMSFKKITNFDKFKSLYLNDEFEEEDDNDNEPTYAKIC